MHAALPSPSPTPLQPKDGAVWPSAIFLLLLAGFYFFVWQAASAYSASPDIDLVSWAFSVDLILVVPLLVYAMGVRRLGWPVTTPLPVCLLGLLLAKTLFPAARDGVLADLHWLIVPLELGLIAFILWRTYTLMQQVRTVHRQSLGKTHLDLRKTLEQSAVEILGPGRLAGIMASELAVFAYALGRRQPPPNADHAFTVHRRSGIGLLMGGALIATAAEIVPVHWLLHHFVGAAAAWILTAFSVYGGFWLVGHWRAVQTRPIEMEDDGLTLRQGLIWDLHIPWSRVASLRRVPATEGPVQGALRMTVAGLPSHCLQLTSPCVARGPYGLQKSVEHVTFFVDETARFDAEWKIRGPSNGQDIEST